jgi:hypothetical protein
VVLWIGRTSVFVHTFCDAAQGFDGNPVCRLDEFARHRLKLFQDTGVRQEASAVFQDWHSD